MENTNIYKEIALRSNGDIYLGVVGPVRTGKSTFITNFVKQLVIPNIQNPYAKQRAIDELPQSAQGKTVMTTEPKFVPNEAAKLDIDGIKMNLRLVDCVGYAVQGAMGYVEAQRPRFVKTPWSSEEMPFEQAAELGTRKVISEHSNFDVLVTTDGSFSEIGRANFIQAEEKVVKELKENLKPFVIVLNTKSPTTKDTAVLKASLEQKYHAPVVPIDVLNLKNDDIVEIFESMLQEFPINSIKVKMPKWLEALNFDNPLIQEIISEVKNASTGVDKIGEFKLTKALFGESPNFEPLGDSKILLGEGNIAFDLEPKPELFYRVLSDQCGYKIETDYQLISYIKELSFAKTQYDKIKVALNSVNETGYGVVFPTMEEMTLEDPEIVRQGSKFGVRLKASAPSLHIMRVDISTEVSPIVGTEQQSEELVKYLLAEFENNPQGIWETNMFGKSLHNLVNEGLINKISAMPVEAQKKMRKTMGKIINEGKGGIICILL
jgi:stage IV sporulation protein A